MKKSPLSAAMVMALADAIDHGGKLVRHVGGYWSWPGCPRRQSEGVPEEYHGASTIAALVARGELEYSEWRDGRAGRFPIAVTVKQSAENAA